MLEPKLHKPGVKISKWKKGIRGGSHMGYIHIHSYIFGLILNFRSGSMTHQYNVVYNDMFMLVHSNEIVD